MKKKELQEKLQNLRFKLKDSCRNKFLGKSILTQSNTSKSPLVYFCNGV